jgi:hypothetical protein
MHDSISAQALLDIEQTHKSNQAYQNRERDRNYGFNEKTALLSGNLRAFAPKTAGEGEVLGLAG